MDVKQVLIEARRLIAEKGWTQGVNARNSKGRVVKPTYKGAVCFCIYGALGRVVEELSEVHDEAVALLEHEVQPKFVSEWNDTPGRTREEVLAVFDRAIGEL